jgi:PAS domain S-box-containing protein
VPTDDPTTLKAARQPPWDEHARVQALLSYEVLDTPREKDFDDIAALASAICETPIAAVNLIGDRRQFFKAEIGLGVRETPFESSFCATAILEDEFLMVEDAAKDGRFNGNPLVTGEPRLRFYAGALLKTAGGLPIGSVCVLDFKPRALSEFQQGALRILARQVMTQMELRRLLRSQAADHAGDMAAVEDLRASDERSKLAQAAGRLGTFEFDIVTNTVIASREMCRMFGLAAQHSYPADIFEDRIAPQDRDAASLMKPDVQGRDRSNVEYRIRRADDGRERWIVRKSEMIRNASGIATRMFGAVTDVTDAKNAQARTNALLQVGDAFREAVSSTDVLGAAGASLGRVLHVDRAGYSRVSVDLGQLRVETDWTADGVASIAGHHDLASFPVTAQRLRAGEILSVADTIEADWLGPDRAAYLRQEVRAFLMFPILVQGLLVGALFAHEIKPRRWSPAEIAFMRSLADRAHQALARVDAEEQRRLLNNELAHRLKNTLAVVQSIASQTLRDAHDREAVAAFQERLRALAVSHDILLRQSWTAARMDAVVEGAMSLHGNTERVKISGPPVQLGPRTVLSLSLLLHELATNAAKYGALSNSSGIVSIEWETTGLHENADHILRWTETGGPAVVAPQRKGFGSRLIGMGLGSGGVKLDYRPEGLFAEFSNKLRTLTAIE